MSRSFLYQRALHRHVLFLYGITLMIGLLFCSIWFFWWFSPLSDEILRLQAAAFAGGQKSAHRSKNQDQIKNQKELAAQSLSSFASHQEKMPLELVHYSLIDMFTDIANDAHVTLYSCVLEADQKEEWYRQVPLKLVLSGTQKEITQFFSGISKSIRLLSLDQMDMTLRNQDIFDVVIYLNAYLIPKEN